MNVFLWEQHLRFWAPTRLGFWITRTKILNLLTQDVLEIFLDILTFHFSKLTCSNSHVQSVILSKYLFHEQLLTSNFFSHKNFLVLILYRLNFGRLLHPDWRSPNGGYPVRVEEQLPDNIYQPISENFRPPSDNRCSTENQFTEEAGGK